MIQKLIATLMIISAFALFGCEGEEGPVGPAGPQGPAGPGTILAFGDIDFTVGPDNDNALSFGPQNRVDSVLVDDTIQDGVFIVSCFGSYPDTAGTLLLSGSSDQSVASDITVTGTISSWGDTLIVFRAQTYNTATHVLDGDDFSFVIFGE